MKKKISVVAGLIMLGTTSLAMAQVSNTTQGTGGGAAPAANIDITLTGTIESSVQLTIDGASLSAETNVTGAPSTAIVDFGTFSTTTPLGSIGADVAARSTSGTPGLFVGAELTATLTYSGTSTGSISIERAAAAGAAPDVPAGNLRFGAAGTTWADAATSGSAIADPGVAAVDLCGGTCTNTTAYPHELAVFVPDTQAAGAFTTVVRYTGTAP